MFNIYESNKPAISLNLEIETMSYFCANRISSLHSIYKSYFENEMGKQSARFAYLFSKLCDGSSFIIRNVISELDKSSFRPIAFEQGMSFGQYLIDYNGKNIFAA